MDAWRSRGLLAIDLTTASSWMATIGSMANYRRRLLASQNCGHHCHRISGKRSLRWSMQGWLRQIQVGGLLLVRELNTPTYESVTTA